MWVGEGEEERRCDHEWGRDLRRNRGDNVKHMGGQGYQEEEHNLMRSDIDTFLAALSSTAGTSGR